MFFGARFPDGDGGEVFLEERAGRAFGPGFATGLSSGIQPYVA
jgi:hypothetical protein